MLESLKGPAIRFTDAFLVQELDQSSPASGLEKISSGSEDNDSSFASGLMWLVEKRHASERVQRFCGTLKHTSTSSDLAHLTISAFNHFVYQFTRKTLIYADLQGVFPCIYVIAEHLFICSAGTPGLVTVDDEEVEGTFLFDPMTHTETGYVTINLTAESI